MTGTTDPHDAMDAPALSVRDLSYSFKNRRALSSVSFSVDPGTIHGFVGPNGAGKTTTLKVISTLLSPFKGRVHVFGDDVRAKTFRVRRAIGYMPDHFGMYRQMTVFEYLDFFAAAYGQAVERRDKTITDVLQLTDMDGRQNDLIKTLSRGMQQRVSLARVLVHDPKLLLLDEPASGLDPRARIELMEILRELCRMGKTVLISSHILSELGTLCDAVTIIDRGHVKYTGTMDDLLAHSGHYAAFRIGLTELSSEIEQAVRGLSGVAELTVEDQDLVVEIDTDRTDSGALLRTVLDAGGTVASFNPLRRQLDEAFMDLTDPGVGA